jgi:hypothetical protein
LALGSLYDALEQLKWTLVSANSDDGILFVREPTTGIPFVIRVCQKGSQTMELSAALASGEFSGRSLPEECMARLLQTLDAILAAVSVSQLPDDESKE